jgi:hypothetical protein
VISVCSILGRVCMRMPRQSGLVRRRSRSGELSELALELPDRNDSVVVALALGSPHPLLLHILVIAPCLLPLVRNFDLLRVMYVSVRVCCNVLLREEHRQTYDSAYEPQRCRRNRLFSSGLHNSAWLSLSATKRLSESGREPYCREGLATHHTPRRKGTLAAPN